VSVFSREIVAFTFNQQQHQRTEFPDGKTTKKPGNKENLRNGTINRMATVLVGNSQEPNTEIKISAEFSHRLRISQSCNEST